MNGRLICLAMTIYSENPQILKILIQTRECEEKGVILKTLKSSTTDLGFKRIFLIQTKQLTIVLLITGAVK
mgnify:CR=1 FL=1